MNRAVSLCIGLAAVLAFAFAANIPSEITLYFMEAAYLEKLGPMPSGALTSYQVDTEGLNGTTFKTSGSTANITSDGLIKPVGTVWYWKGGVGTTAYMPDPDRITISYKSGVTTFTVKAVNFSQTIKVNVTDYSAVLFEERINEIIAANITSGMTQLQKLQTITRWIGQNTDYSVSYQSAKAMILLECGDCWASTNTILEFCKRLGIEAWSRRGNQDPLSGSGHRNAIAYIDGTFYIAEAGYSGKRPRGGNVYEEPLGFSVSGSTIYQYDGKNTSVTIPSKIGNKNITQLGNSVATVFVNGGVESLHITESVVTMGPKALYDTGIKTITVDPKNEGLEVVDNILYTKSRNKLIYCPSNKETVVIDDNTTEIGYCALSGIKVDRLVIPENVRTLNFAILYQAKVGKLIIRKGIENIGETAFQGLSTPKITLPDTVKTMDAAPFYSSNISTIVLSKNLVSLPIGCFQSSYVQKVYLPPNLESIGEQAFYGCSKLENITIPETVKEIGNNAFSKSTKNIFFVGSESDWNKIKFNSTIPDTTTVVYDSEPEPFPEPDPDDMDASCRASVLLAAVIISAVVGLLF